MTVAAHLNFADDAASTVLERARWAASTFAKLDRAATLKIAKAVAEAGFARAALYGEWAVRETGYGVAEHKRLKNELCSRGIYDAYKDRDFAGPVIEPQRKMVRFARPAGVILALTPSTNPIATLYFKAMLAMLTRNAIVLSPHPAAKACSADAADWLAQAARVAGAPDGIIQCVHEPTIAMVQRLMSDRRVDLIVATGGLSVVEAAYRSGHPALGVGPGNAPVYIHASADLSATARWLIESKSFDNSILCTNESVVLADAAIAERLLDCLKIAGAHVCSENEATKLRRFLWDADGAFNVAGALGKDAVTIARAAGIGVMANTKVLVAPIAVVQPEDFFTREKLCPVLGFAKVADSGQAVSAARSMMRRAGRGHSAAVHAKDERAIMAFAAGVPALRIVVNAPLSQGAAGFGTHLGPTMTVGTGFGGGSALGENLTPNALIDWVRVAYNTEEAMGRFEGIPIWRTEPVMASDEPIAFSMGSPAGSPPAQRPAPRHYHNDNAILREEIRKLVVEELRLALGGR